MWLQHATAADIAAGLLARGGSEQLRAALAQRFDICLHRRMRPHLLVHRRRQIQRCGAGQTQRGQQIVGQPVRQPRDQVRAGRRNEDAFSPARQLDMSHGSFGLLIPQTDPHTLSGQRLKRGRADEVGGALRHHHAHLRIQVAQATDQFAGFVGGNATRHSQQDSALSKTHVRRA